MKISIENFKSIKKLHNFEIKPMTILSGVNSSGKSSFVQLLLLLKQTVERNSADEPFYLDGDLYPVREFKDIVSNHNLANSINISFLFDKNEVLSLRDSDINIFKLYDFLIHITVKISSIDDSILVKEFEAKIETLEEVKNPYINFKYNDGSYLVDTNDTLFSKEIWNKVNMASVKFLSFYPLILQESENYPSEEIVIKLDWVKNLVNSFFGKMSYIGPYRVAPQEEYLPKRNLKSVNHTGDNVAQILENFAKESIQYYQITSLDGVIKYQSKNAFLTDAVKYWMCDIFKIAEDLQAEKIGENYRIGLISETQLLTSIKHVGFGISQLLPIVVEGLRMPSGGTLIVEQPEIHLHPKLQSLLFDFLYGLTLQGKNIIVETHSSHFITRMRRRIAEDENDEMDGKINLTFIEDNIFRSIGLNDYGTMNYYPENFIEPSNSELRAIVKAQTRKRKKNEKP